MEGREVGEIEGRELGDGVFFDALSLLLEADGRFDFFDASLNLLGALVGAFNDLDF
jgi:hypothetical protein